MRTCTRSYKLLYSLQACGVHNMYSNLASMLVHCHPKYACATHYPEQQSMTQHPKYPTTVHSLIINVQYSRERGSHYTPLCLLVYHGHNPPTEKGYIVLTAKMGCQHGIQHTARSNWHVQTTGSCRNIMLRDGRAAMQDVFSATVSRPHTCMHG